MRSRLRRVLGGRQAGGDAPRPPAPIYLDLRDRILTGTPGELGIPATARHPRVWGALLDMGVSHGVATLVSLADGATSLYTSTGGGIIGGGERPVVAAATLRFLDGVEARIDSLGPADSFPLPTDGRSRFTVLMHDGERRAAEADSDEMGEGRDPLSPLFHLAQDVITQLRLIDEQRRDA